MSWRSQFLYRRGLEFEMDEMPLKDRPRFGKGKTYTTTRTRRIESAIKAEWLEKFGMQYAVHAGPVNIRISVARPLAKRNPKKDKGKADIIKPDADNIAKAVCDALNGCAYKDDSQVNYLNIKKLNRLEYGARVRVSIVIDYFREKFYKENHDKEKRS